MPPRAVKMTAGTAGPKKAAAKSPSKTKTAQITKKTPLSKPKPEIVENVEMLEQATPVEETKVPVNEQKSIEDGKLKGLSTKDAAPAEEPTPMSEYAPEKDAEEDAKEPFDEDDKGQRLELYENVSRSEPEEEEEEDDATAMDVDQDSVAQEDEEKVFEDYEKEEGEGTEEEVGEEREGEEEDEQHEVVEIGEVVEIRLMMNPQTQKNKGFAFIRYAAVDQAKRAYTELKNPQVKGKVCGVSPSQDIDTIFLGNISKTWTKKAVSFNV